MEMAGTWVHHVSTKNFYKKSPYFNLYFNDLKNILSVDYDNFSSLSITLIKYFIDKLDISTNIVLSSDICKDSKLQGLEKIFFILDNLKAQKYLSSDGPGSMRYINENDFKSKNIELVWQKFNHPTYNQLHGDFKSYLSIIDLLFNYGEDSKKYII